MVLTICNGFQMQSDFLGSYFASSFYRANQPEAYISSVSMQIAWQSLVGPLRGSFLLEASNDLLSVSFSRILNLSHFGTSFGVVLINLLPLTKYFRFSWTNEGLTSGYLDCFAFFN